MENHELVGRGDRFPEGARLVFWTHVLGGGPGDVVHHVWVHEGEVVTRAELALGSPSWRTHSRRLLEPGRVHGRCVLVSLVRVPRHGLEHHDLVAHLQTGVGPGEQELVLPGAK